VRGSRAARRLDPPNERVQGLSAGAGAFHAIVVVHARRRHVGYDDDQTARRSAVAAPMPFPLPQPVMSTTRWSISIMFPLHSVREPDYSGRAGRDTKTY